MLVHHPNGPTDIEIFCYKASINEICKNLCNHVLIVLLKQVNTVDEILFDGGNKKKYVYVRDRMSPNQSKDPKNNDRIASNISSIMSSLSK